MQAEIVKTKNTVFTRIIVVLLSVLFLALAGFVSYKIIVKIQNSPSMSKVYAYWKSGDYAAVYNETAGVLALKPFDPSAEAYHGYSCFYLGISSTDTTEARQYLDECIFSLRLAMTKASDVLIPQICYLLGKAYFHKDNLAANHYYADLVVKYINQALSYGYEASDIPEYLGLSYAQLGMTSESIAAFTEALLVNDSDVLLLSIAEQYIKNGRSDVAKQYLVQLIKKTKDQTKEIDASCMLAEIFISEGSLDMALEKYNDVLSKNENCADAYYGIGVIYELQGDLVKARAEWRKALKAKANHQGALQKLGKA